MVPKEIEITKKLKDGTTKKFIMRRFEEKDVHRIFMAWNNPQSYRFNSIDWNERSIKYMVDRPWPTDYGMYHMVLEDAETHELLATCRFGRYWNSKTEDKIWDFGYSTFRSDDKEDYTLEDIKNVFKNGVQPDALCWGKGYSSIMVEEIIKIAQNEGIVQIRSGANGANWGSQKVIMKNGLKFLQVDKDGDVDFSFNLRDENGNSNPITKPKKDELDAMWEQHVKMVEERRNRLCMKIIIRNANIKQYAESLFLLLMAKASKIDGLNETKLRKKAKIEDLKQEIVSIYLKFTFKEKRMVNRALKNYKQRWIKRIGNEQYEQSEVEFNLRCCEMVKDIIKGKTEQLET